MRGEGRGIWHVRHKLPLPRTRLRGRVLSAANVFYIKKTPLCEGVYDEGGKTSRGMAGLQDLSNDDAMSIIHRISRSAKSARESYISNGEEHVDFAWSRPVAVEVLYTPTYRTSIRCWKLLPLLHTIIYFEWALDFGWCAIWRRPCEPFSTWRRLERVRKTRFLLLYCNDGAKPSPRPQPSRMSKVVVSALNLLNGIVVSCIV